MAAKHKLTTQEFEIDYTLLAIHTGVEDFTLAYLLNKVLKMNFKRLKNDLEIAKGSSVAVFNWENERTQSIWHLIANKAVVEEQKIEPDLFQQSTIKTKTYLIPEHKEVDFFVKIEDDQKPLDQLIQKIKTIPDILTVYRVDHKELKSKLNLIF